MDFLIKCPNCCRNLSADATAADRRFKCPLCGKLFKVPNKNEYRKASKIIKSSQTSLYVDQQGKIFG
jgi:DNA-directed RNA polymerase subunit M/transcription elongation factor TFIIS